MVGLEGAARAGARLSGRAGAGARLSGRAGAGTRLCVGIKGTLLITGPQFASVSDSLLESQ